MMTSEQIERIKTSIVSYDKGWGLHGGLADRDALAALLAAVESDPLTRLEKWLRKDVTTDHRRDKHDLDCIDIDTDGMVLVSLVRGDDEFYYNGRAPTLAAALIAALDAAEKGVDRA